MILRVTSELTSKDYITQRGWESASLVRCPLHPGGGCGMRRHTSYERHNPAGLVVPRWYCRKGHTTFSLVPDFAASYVSDSLPAIEAAVLAFEAQSAAGATVAAIAESLRPESRPTRRSVGCYYAFKLGQRVARCGVAWDLAQLPVSLLRRA